MWVTARAIWIEAGSIRARKGSGNGIAMRCISAMSKPAGASLLIRRVGKGRTHFQRGRDVGATGAGSNGRKGRYALHHLLQRNTSRFAALKAGYKQLIKAVSEKLKSQGVVRLPHLPLACARGHAAGSRKGSHFVALSEPARRHFFLR